ncbi:MAG: hypothetical protein PQJ59_06350 [Spirochaetales bacterium]|nr:hypothetical protein [Spirochaetales bacterium]
MMKNVPAYKIKAVMSGSRGFTLSAEALHGGFLPGREALHWPSLKQIRLKESQLLSGATYELQIKGLRSSDIREGDLILPADWDSGRCRKALFYCPRGPEYAKDSAKKVSTLVADPLSKRKIKVNFTYTGCLARAEFSDPVLGIKGAPYEFYHLDEPLILVARGEVSRSDAAFTGKALSSWEDQSNLYREYMALELGLRGYAFQPLEYDDITLPRTEKGARILIRSNRYKTLSAKLKKRASAMGGMSEDILKDHLEKHVLALMLSRGELIRSGRWILVPGKDSESSLSPMARRQLTLLREGEGSLNPALSKDRGARENWEAMGRMGLVMYHEGIVMTRERYEKEAEAIVKGLKEAGPSELAEIRPFSKLSRRELLIVLDWMEKDRLIINREDIREAAH